MSKRGNSIGHASPNQMMEEQPMIPWVRVDEFYPDDLDNTEVEDNKDMEDAFRFTRETEYQPPQDKYQPTIISLKLPKKVGFFKVL